MGYSDGLIPQLAADDGATRYSHYRTFYTMSDGYKLDCAISFPRTGAGPYPICVFGHGSGGSRLTNYGSAQTVANNGIIGISMSVRGQGEGGLGYVNPDGLSGNKTWSIRDAIDVFDVIEAVYAGMPGDVDLTKIAYSGSSQGGQIAAILSALSGRTPDADVQALGWRDGTAYPTMTFVEGGNFGLDIYRTLLPGFESPDGDNLRFQAFRNWRSSKGTVQGLWTEAGYNGTLIDPDVLSELLEGEIEENDVAGVKTALAASLQHRQLYANYRTWFLASDVHISWYASVIDQWQEPDTSLRMLAANTGSGDKFIYLGSGGHQSTHFASVEAARDLRLLACLKYYLNGDASARDDMGNGPHANWAAVDEVRGIYVPVGISTYQDTATAPVEWYAASIAGLLGVSETTLFLRSDYTLGGTSAALVSRSFNRTWDTATTPADLNTAIDQGREIYDEIWTDGLLDNTEYIDFTYTVTSSLNIIGARVVDGQYASDNANFQLGWVLFLTRGGEMQYIGGGMIQGDDWETDLVTLVDQDCELEMVPTQVVNTDVLTLRCMPIVSKGHNRYVGKDANLIAMPFFDDAEHGFTIRKTAPKIALKLRLV
jgi:hypothetical protein